MRLNLTAEQLDSLTWMEWHNRKHDTTTAHAVDPTSVARTGVLRSINGAVIPPEAIPAYEATPKDPFSLHIISLARTKIAQDADRAAERTAKRKPRPDGVTIKDETAEVWKDGVVVGTFPAEVLGGLADIVASHLARREEAEKNAERVRELEDAHAKKKKPRAKKNGAPAQA